MRYRLDPLSPTGLSPDEPRKKDLSGAFVSNGVDSIAKAGEVQLKRNVTLSAGSNVTLTQSGQNIEIAATGGGGGGSGDVVGPAISTDNAITRYDGTTGKIIQNSTVTVSDTGDIATSGTVDGRDVSVDGARLDVITDANYLNANTTKAQVGLGNVDNTSDLNKPISTATQTALDTKVDENAAIIGATKTKITYDAKGLVTAGADATTADIADSLNKRYVTDADLVDIGNLSGTNTGDQTSIVGITGTTAQFNTALTDNDFATLAGTETLSNKTLTNPRIGTIDDSSGNDIVDLAVPSMGVSQIRASSTNNLRIAPGTSTARLSFADGADLTKVLTLNNSGATTATATTLAVSQTANRTLTLPDATDTLVGRDTTDTLTNKTLTTPTISSFTNASHNHTNAAGGGQLTDSALSSAVTVSKGGTGNTTLTSGNVLVGAGTSAVTTTKAAPAGNFVGTSDTQTLTNKTLTAPKLGSAGFIADVNGNEIIKTSATVASAVNEITVTNAATATNPSISATGGDTNISLNLVSKGTGRVLSNGVQVADLTSSQTFLSKTIDAGLNTISGLTNSSLSTASGALGGAWTSTTPTITTAIGSLTTRTCQAYHTVIGKTVMYYGKITITNNGTGAGGLFVPLPVTAARLSAGVMHGREVAVTGRGVTGVMDTTSRCYITYSSDNTYPGGTGSNIIDFSITYEAA